jgi:hypothetical protein
MIAKKAKEQGCRPGAVLSLCFVNSMLSELSGTSTRDRLCDRALRRVSAPESSGPSLPAAQEPEWPRFETRTPDFTVVDLQIRFKLG